MSIDDNPLTTETENAVAKNAERRAKAILQRLSSSISSNWLVRYVISGIVFLFALYNVSRKKFSPLNFL